MADTPDPDAARANVADLILALLELELRATRRERLIGYLKAVEEDAHEAEREVCVAIVRHALGPTRADQPTYAREVVNAIRAPRARGQQEAGGG